MVTPPLALPRDTGFVEIADRVWVARHAWFDVNVTVVAGERGLLVVDTLASEDAGRGLVETLRRQIAGPRSLDVVTVVNTHEHFDHWFGNAAVRAAYPDVELVAHDEATSRMLASAADFKEKFEALPDEPRRDEVIASTLVPAETTFSSVHTVDLGDRVVEVVHPGKGHTSGDVVLRVEDADVLLAGDLVEESADRNGVPGFGDDCHPMAWPLSLDLVISLLGPDTVVVPGHGNPVDREFVDEQRNAIGAVAETIRDLAGRGVPESQALEAAEWPYPREELAAAVRRGYAALPRVARQLPLV
ncbi:MAG: beta-lactamase domain protein [Nocardioidaceae bacterium]|nr:beta-lactamase domain protein [Nocardioidaceae bacterium]